MRKLQVTLIEPNRTFTACPFSNEVIAGLREIDAQQFTYDRIVAEGVDRRSPQAAATGSIRKPAWSVSPTARSLGYDRLVLAPGIDLRFDALPGYDEAAAAKMPHAWKAGRADRAVAQAARSHGRRRPGCDRGCPPAHRAVRRRLTSVPA